MQPLHRLGAQLSLGLWRRSLTTSSNGSACKILHMPRRASHKVCNHSRKRFTLLNVVPIVFFPSQRMCRRIMPKDCIEVAWAQARSSPACSFCDLTIP